MSRRREWVWWLAALAALVAFLWLFSAILLPFVAGFAIAYLLDPAVDRIERLRMPRWAATGTTLALFFVIAVATLLLLAPVLDAQLGRFLDQLPRYTARLREIVQPIVQDLLDEVGGGGRKEVTQAVGGMADKAIAVVGGLLGGLWSGGLLLFNILSLLVVTPIVAFYLLRDWDRIVAKVDGYLPLRHRDVVRKLSAEIDEVLSGFIRGQAVVCLFLGAFYAIGLTLVGLDLGLVIGIFAGIVSFIPYLGAITGLLLSLLPAITQFGSDLWSIGLVVGVFVVGQFIEGNFLSPRVIGDKTRLHPVWIMFALLAGGALLGFVGVLVAVPIAASAGVVIRFLLRRYLASRLYLGAAAPAPAIPPPEPRETG
jgi:predicted PurR-regulated permease PerM